MNATTHRDTFPSLPANVETRPCPECHGAGVLIELTTDAAPQPPTCGVCLGDGCLIVTPGHDIHDVPPSRFVDHSSTTHTCPRC